MSKFEAFAHADVLDSREIIARFEYLESLEDDRDEDEQDEYVKLSELVEQADNIPDWLFGATLIHDDYFVTYAEELAEDIGAIDRNAGWPLAHIDWEDAAEALQVDYTSVEFDGETYWVRS